MGMRFKASMNAENISVGRGMALDVNWNFIARKPFTVFTGFL